jgi:hypothetical protein
MIESTYTIKSGVILFPVSVLTISDRESCYREFYTPSRDEDGSYINVSYTVADERRPEVKGRVRVDALSCTTMKVLPGSNGNATECFRMFKFNPHVRQRHSPATAPFTAHPPLYSSQFHGALGFINSTVALKASELIAKPLETLRTKVEGLIYEYEVLNGPSLAEVTFEGFDHNGKYNPAEHTDADVQKKEEAEKLLHEGWMQRVNPKMGWTEMLKEDVSGRGSSKKVVNVRLDHGMSCYHKYDSETQFGEAMAHCYVKATPKQVAGFYADKREIAGSTGEFLEFTYTTELVSSPQPISAVKPFACGPQSRCAR